MIDAILGGAAAVLLGAGCGMGHCPPSPQTACRRVLLRENRITPGTGCPFPPLPKGEGWGALHTGRQPRGLLHSSQTCVTIEPQEPWGSYPDNRILQIKGRCPCRHASPPCPPGAPASPVPAPFPHRSRTLSAPFLHRTCTANAPLFRPPTLKAAPFRVSYLHDRAAGGLRPSGRRRAGGSLDKRGPTWLLWVHQNHQEWVVTGPGASSREELRGKLAWQSSHSSTTCPSPRHTPATRPD